MTVADVVDQLLDMEDHDFEQALLANLRPDGPAEAWAALTAPEVVHRTRDVLGSLITVVGTQLTLNRANPRAFPDRTADWVARTTRFLTMLQRRQAQARAASRDAHREHQAAMTNTLLPLVRALTQGVNTHRLACLAAGVEPEAHDVALWNLLDDLALPCDRRHDSPSTLAEMVVGAWRPDPERVA